MLCCIKETLLGNEPKAQQDVTLAATWEIKAIPQKASIDLTKK